MSIYKKIDGLIFTRVLLNSYSEKKHPGLIVETVSGNFLNNMHIVEATSPEIKDRFRELIDSNKPIPVDCFLGEYNHKERKVTIFSKAIEWFSGKYNFDSEQVEQIVRLHEYAHAILHLGSSSIEPIADIDAFVDERNNVFEGISEVFHEWMAQSLTYSALYQDNFKEERETFRKMMEQQPEIYKIDTEEVESFIEKYKGQKDSHSYIWTCILDNIRTGNLHVQDLTDW